MNEVSVCSNPRPMSIGHGDRSEELVPPFESRHCIAIIKSSWSWVLAKNLRSEEVATTTKK